MRRFIAALACCFASALLSQSTTPNLQLQLPTYATQNWNIPVNSNFSKVDTAIGQIQVPYQGTWSSTQVYQRGNQVTYNGGFYTSIINSNFNNNPVTATSAWLLLPVSGTSYPGCAPNSNGISCSGSLVGSTGQFGASVTGPTFTMTNLSSIGASWIMDVTSAPTAMQSLLSPTTVSSLGSATSGNKGTLRQVSDGTSTSDCSTGGGSAQSLCLSNGVSWIAVIGNVNLASPGPIGGTASNLGYFTSAISSGQPVLDIRHPSFAGGAVFDNATDIGPALQAAVNALPSQGGEILLACGSTSSTWCWWANPTTFNWGTHSGAVTIFVQGVLHAGTTFALTSLNTAVHLIGKGGYSIAQFQAPGESAAIYVRPSNNVPATGTLGTAVTSTNVPTTVTLSSMNGVYPGSALEIVNKTSCTASTITRAGSQTTATFSSACHIPPGTAITVSGCADSTYNGTWAGGSAPQNFLEIKADYVLNKLVWNNSGTSGSTTGCTVAGMSEDNIETVQVTSTTSTTATATFNRTHAATDQFGLVAVTLGGPAGTVAREVRDLQIIGDGLGMWMQQDYLTRLDHVGITATGACNGNYTNFPLEIQYSSFITMDGVAFNTGCIPWSIRLSNGQGLGYTGSGPIYLTNSFIMSGIKADHGGSGIYIRNTVGEQTVRGLVTFDPTNYNTYNGNVSTIDIENSGVQDNSNNVASCLVSYEYSPLGNYGGVVGGSNVTLKQMGSNTCMVNEYFGGSLSIDTPNQPAQYGDVTAKGVQGTYSDGKTVEAELRGVNAGMAPAAVPYVTQPVPITPSSWATGSCTVTPGVLAPDGSHTAGSLTGTSGASNHIYTYSVPGAPAVGDSILYGGWVYSPTFGQTAQPQGNLLNLDNVGSSHFYFATGTSGQDNTNRFDSGIINDWWHPVVGLATITQADGTAGSIRLSIGCDALRTMEYWQPFMSYIPASAGIPIAEINRYREQLLHGAVPPNYNGPGIPATADPIATNGYYVFNPSGGAPIPLLTNTLTGYSTDGGGGTGDTVAIAKGRFTQSTNTLCPNGPNGELTTSGCTGSYTLPPATTSTLGGVKCDGTTTTCAGDGTISASLSGTGVLTTAGGQTISSADTLSGLSAGCLQLPCVAAKGTQTLNNSSGTNLTICTSCPAGQYRLVADIRVTTTGTTGAQTNLLYSYTDDIGATGNISAIANSSATTNGRYAAVGYSFHVAASTNVAILDSCNDSAICQVDWTLERLQ